MGLIYKADLQIPHSSRVLNFLFYRFAYFSRNLNCLIKIRRIQKNWPIKFQGDYWISILVSYCYLTGLVRRNPRLGPRCLAAHPPEIGAPLEGSAWRGALQPAGCSAASARRLSRNGQPTFTASKYLQKSLVVLRIPGDFCKIH